MDKENRLVNVRMELNARFAAHSLEEEARRIAQALDGPASPYPWEIASLADRELGVARVCRVRPGRVLHVVGDSELAEQLRELYRSGEVPGWSSQPMASSRTPLAEVRDRLAAAGAGPNRWHLKLQRYGFSYAEEVTSCPDAGLLDLTAVGRTVLAELRDALPYAPRRHAPLAADGAREPGVEPGIVTGNAAADADVRGWLVGHFASRESGRHANQVEVKWASHPTGQKQDAWSPPAAARTLTILVAGGAFRVDVGEESLVLREPGDYVLFGPGHTHRWHALDAATMLTVRWPSAPAR